MAGLSDYMENLIGSLILRTQVATKPAAVWVGLFTAAPTDAGGGTEVSGGSYARVQVAQADAQWNAPSAGNGLFSNVNDITFPAPTANWGTIVAFGIFDANTAGNLLIWNTLTTNKTVNNGDPEPKFTGGAPGALQITFD
jgi:hypothetical protein